MRLLWDYLSRYRGLVALALLLAAINQVFSLLDPLIFRHVIDQYATRYRDYTTGEFFRGVSLLLLAAVGVAFVSRVAKNFQDYCINVITQRLGARLYADGVRHSLDLPYATFEDQRSGETLGVLQKVRADVEKLIAVSINVALHDARRHPLRDDLRLHGALDHRARIPADGPVARASSARRSAAASSGSRPTIVRETTGLAGSTTESLRNIELVKSLGLANQEVARLNGTTEKILALELKKVRYLRSLSFIQGTAVNALRTSIMFLMLYLIFTQRDHGRPVLLAVHLLVLHLRAAAGAGQRDQHLPGDRGVAAEIRGAARACRWSRDPRTRCSWTGSRRWRSSTSASRTRARGWPR